MYRILQYIIPQHLFGSRHSNRPWYTHTITMPPPQGLPRRLRTHGSNTPAGTDSSLYLADALTVEERATAVAVLDPQLFVIIVRFLGEPDQDLPESTIRLVFSQLFSISWCSRLLADFYQYWYDWECDISFHHWKSIITELLVMDSEQSSISRQQSPTVVY